MIHALVHAPGSLPLTCICALLIATPASAAPRHNIHLGTGWQNTGASRALTWEPAIQGSRKDVPLIAGWSLVGSRRVYYAPFARIKYTNTWSIGGATNLLGLDLGFGGLGVYLTRPPVAHENPTGRWYAVFEVNLANLRIGGNISPHAPKDSGVDDPDAQREKVAMQVANGEFPDHHIQRYPFGAYSYVELAFPIHIRAWKQIRDDLGVGFFFESTVFGLEWPLDRRVTHFAQVYNVIVGLSFTLGQSGRRALSASRRAPP